jgi:hypothetical protein
MHRLPLIWARQRNHHIRKQLGKIIMTIGIQLAMGNRTLAPTAQLSVIMVSEIEWRTSLPGC